MESVLEANAKQVYNCYAWALELVSLVYFFKALNL